MSKEKQIEEMAKYCPCYFGEKCCIDGELPEKCDMLCQFGTYAEILYNAGYRKQSEGEWISNELGGYKYAFYCSECGWVDGYPFNDRHKYCPNCGSRMSGGNNDGYNNK